MCHSCEIPCGSRSGDGGGVDDDEDNGCHVWMTTRIMGATPRDLHERVRVRVDNVIMMMVKGWVRSCNHNVCRGENHVSHHHHAHHHRQKQAPQALPSVDKSPTTACALSPHSRRHDARVCMYCMSLLQPRLVARAGNSKDNLNPSGAPLSRQISRDLDFSGPVGAQLGLGARYPRYCPRHCPGFVPRRGHYPLDMPTIHRTLSGGPVHFLCSDSVVARR